MVVVKENKPQQIMNLMSEFHLASKVPDRISCIISNQQIIHSRKAGMEGLSIMKFYRDLNT